MVLVRDSQMGKVSGRFCVRGWDHRRTSTVRLSLGRETQKGKVADWVRGGALLLTSQRLHDAEHWFLHCGWVVVGLDGTVGVCPSGCSSVTPAELGWEGASDPGVIGAISFFIFFGGILGGGHRSWVP
ncbi:hypothetical protein Dimus_008528 [Dionaea muscipula]